MCDVNSLEVEDKKITITMYNKRPLKFNGCKGEHDAIYYADVDDYSLVQLPMVTTFEFFAKEFECDPTDIVVKIRQHQERNSNKKKTTIIVTTSAVTSFWDSNSNSDIRFQVIVAYNDIKEKIDNYEGDGYSTEMLMTIDDNGTQYHYTEVELHIVIKMLITFTRLFILVILITIASVTGICLACIFQSSYFGNIIVGALIDKTLNILRNATTIGNATTQTTDNIKGGG